MATQDTSQIKEKIISTLRNRGPSLPVHISDAINSSMLFSSAFLSELVAEKKIKMSHMRVGSSPIYYLEEQENKIENFSNYLKSKEKDAFQKIKEEKFLIDDEQEPAIRVALREIKDFAKPFKNQERIIWRYFTESENNLEQKEEFPKKELQKEGEMVPEEKGGITVQKQEEQIKKPEEEIISQEKTLDIFEKAEEEPKKEQVETKEKKKIPSKKPAKKKTSQKKNEKFFNKVKEFLSEKEIEILDIIGFDKSELVLKIKEPESYEEKLLIAFNKKKISEADILKSYKKSQEHELKYVLLAHSEPTKKTTNIIEAIKNLSKIENMEGN